jgi:hypothetical protein
MIKKVYRYPTFFYLKYNIMKGDLTKELVIRSIKIFDMGYAAVVYILSAIVIISILNKYSGKYNEEVEEKKSTKRLFWDVILRTWIIAVLAYFIRNLFQMVPFPLEGVYGFEHLKVKEVLQSSLFVSFMVIFDSHLQSRVGILKKRISKI